MSSKMRSEIIKLLERNDLEGLVDLSKKQNIIRRLIAMTYDMEDQLSWRAMEAVGKIAASLSPEEAREVVRRILWMMREESGSNAWSGPDLLGEILLANPDPIKDIVPILVSFHEEEFFRAGVLRAMARIAEGRPALIEPYSEVAHDYLGSSDPAVRGYAALVLISLGKSFPREVLIGDETEILRYDNGILTKIALSELAGA